MVHYWLHLGIQYLRNSIKKPLQVTDLQGFKDGAPGEIRTPDRSVRSRVLYPAELQAHNSKARFYGLLGWFASQI